jgi:hypothetical protein
MGLKLKLEKYFIGSQPLNQIALVASGQFGALLTG